MLSAKKKRRFPHFIDHKKWVYIRLIGARSTQMSISGKWKQLGPFGIGGLLFSSVCVAPTAHAQTLGGYGHDFLAATVNFGTLWEPAVSAGWSNFVSKPAGFGTGAESYGYHYGVALADNVSGKFMRDFVFAAASHQPHAYVPLGSGTFPNRIWHALKFTVIVSSQASDPKFNWSGIPASLASAGLSNVYQPAQQRTVLATFERAGTNTAGYIFGNIWLEFTKKPMENHNRIRAMVKSR